MEPIKDALVACSKATRDINIIVGVPIGFTVTDLPAKRRWVNDKISDEQQETHYDEDCFTHR
jgi:hypothetical protein